jgi:Immunity protein 22
MANRTCLEVLRQMEEQGIISLWLAKSMSSDELDKVLQVFYSEDGDFEGSEFTRGFQINFYDENFKESEFFEESKDSLESLLEGFSCDSIIVPRFSKIIGSLKESFNAVILLYNFRHDSNVLEWQYREIDFKFFGSVSYET